MREAQYDYEGRQRPGKDGCCLFLLAIYQQDSVNKDRDSERGSQYSALTTSPPLWATSPTAHSSPIQRIT